MKEWKEKSEIEIDNKRFFLIDCFRGTEGIFWRVWDYEKQMLRGIKIIPVNTLQTDDNSLKKITRFIQEAYVSLLMPEHPNLMRFTRTIVSETNNVVYHITDLIPGITMYDRFFGVAHSELIVLKLYYVLQIVETLMFLDSYFLRYRHIIKMPGGEPDGFYHGDLHMNNVIITPENRAVLIDWGQSYRYINRKNIFPSISPEFHSDSSYSSYRGPKIDVYSIGVMLCYLLTGKTPAGSSLYFSETSVDINDIILQSNERNCLSENKSLSDSFKNIIYQMISYAPDARPKLSEVFETISFELTRLNKTDDLIGSCYYNIQFKTPDKGSVISTALSLFTILKFISSNEKEANIIKAQTIELAMTIIGENNSCFNENDIPFLSSLREKFMDYSIKENILDSFSDPLLVNNLQFNIPSEKEINTVCRQIYNSVITAIKTGMTDYGRDKLLKIFIDAEHPLHFIIYLIKVFSEIQDENVFVFNENTAYEFIISLLEELKYINNRYKIKTEKILNYTINFYYHELGKVFENEYFLQIKHTPTILNKEIFSLKCIIAILINHVNNKKDEILTKSEDFIILVKSLEWKMRWTSFNSVNESGITNDLKNIELLYNNWKNTKGNEINRLQCYMTDSMFISYLIYKIICMLRDDYCIYSKYNNVCIMIKKIMGESEERYSILAFLNDYDMLFKMAMRKMQDNRKIFFPVLQILIKNLHPLFNNTYLRVAIIFNFNNKLKFDSFPLINEISESIQKTIPVVQRYSSIRSKKLLQDLTILQQLINPLIKSEIKINSNLRKMIEYSSLFNEDLIMYEIRKNIDLSEDFNNNFIVFHLTNRSANGSFNIKKIIRLYYYLIIFLFVKNDYINGLVYYSLYYEYITYIMNKNELDILNELYVTARNNLLRTS